MLAAMSSDPARRPGRIRGVFVDVEPLRRDRDYRFLWIGQLISGAGRQVTVVALPFQLYVLTGSTLAVGLLAVVQLVPILVFALGGGAMADAVDAKRMDAASLRTRKVMAHAPREDAGARDARRRPWPRMSKATPIPLHAA